MTSLLIPASVSTLKPLIRNLRGFNPLSLFKDGASGAWYDPSDLSTLFQDSAGTTPVTTDGDPVGLMLDKSKGLGTGVELVTTTTILASEWTSTGATAGDTITITDGNINFNASPIGDAAGWIDDSGIESNGYYEMTFTVENYVEGGLRLRLNTGTVYPVTFPGNGTHTFRFAAGTGVFSGLYGYLNSTFDVTSFSVKKVLGNHAYQSTSGSKPLYRTDGTLHWLEFDGFDDLLTIPELFTGTEDRSQFFAFRSLKPGGEAAGYLLDVGLRSGGSAGEVWGVSPEFDDIFLRVIGSAAWTPAPENNDAVFSLRWGLSLGTLLEDTEAFFNGQPATQISATSTIINTGSTGESTIGANVAGGGNNYEGRIYGLIHVSDLVSDQHREEADKFMAAKAGVTL